MLRQDKRSVFAILVIFAKIGFFDAKVRPPHTPHAMMMFCPKKLKNKYLIIAWGVRGD